MCQQVVPVGIVLLMMIHHHVTGTAVPWYQISGTKKSADLGIKPSVLCFATVPCTIHVLVLTLTFPFRLPYCRVLYMDYHWDHFCSFLPNSPSHATDQDMCPMTVQIHLLPILVVPGNTMATSSISGIPR